MPMDDLFTALNMLKSGVNDLKTSRVLQNANDQVQQIRSSEMADNEKRQALTQLSQQLVNQMGQLGRPASDIAQQAAAFAPPKLDTSKEMAATALNTGDTGLMKQAQQMQAFEEKPMNDKLALQYKYMAPFRQAQLNENMTKAKDNEFAKFNTNIDATAASARTAFGMGGVSLQKAERIKQLMGDPSRWSSLGSQDLTLVGEGLSNLVKNGVATEHEMAALVPKTSGSLRADATQFLTNNPSPANMQGFFQKYSDILDRETQANLASVQDTILSRSSGNARLYKRDPDQFKATVATKLSQFGMPTKPDDVIVNGNTVTTKQMQDIEAKQDLAEKGIKEAYQWAKSSDPQLQQMAQQRFKKAGVDPNTPVNQAVKYVRTGFRIGRY